MIDLAHCDDFGIGAVTVRPSSRELSSTAGTVMVEPKVMQVLVALARTDGRVVSRDDLVAQCWNGRIVGDDAINRIIGKLRRAAETAGLDAFRIETVARTGYRLVVDAATAPSPPVEHLRSAVASRGSRRFARWLAAAAAIAAAVAFVEVARPGHLPSSPEVAIRTTPATAAMPAAVADLETRGLSAMFDDTPERSVDAITYLRQATALAPKSAPVWGSLAMGYVLSLGWAPPSERAAVAARGRDAAARGLALDHGENRSAAALVSLAPTFGNWAAKAAALHAATARAGRDSGPLAYQGIQFMLAVGHDRAALAEVERIVARSPLVPWIRAAQINLLAAAGRLEEADRVAAAVGAIWPRDRLIWFTRFDLAMFNGQPERALAMAADRSEWPNATRADEIALAARTARAVVAHDRHATADVLAALQVAANGHGSAERAIRAAAALGRPDIALAVARRLYSGRLSAQPRATILPLIGLPNDADPPTAALFLPPASALWATPGFMTLVADIGFVDYWRRTGAPDFCGTLEAQAACRTRGIAPPS
jgi:DNA-binding winged helix-turn-helix (wHTH) protein